MTDDLVVRVKLDLKWKLDASFVRFLMEESQLRAVMHLENQCDAMVRKQVRTQLRAIYVANGGSLSNPCFDVCSEAGDAAPIIPMAGA